MKRALFGVWLAVALLVGCQGGELGKFSGTPRTFVNPITETNTHQAKIAFETSQEVVKKYRRDCFGSQQPPYPVSWKMIQSDPVLSVLCKRRVSRYNAMKVAEDKAFAAIITADNFAVSNPTGNVLSYVAAAYRAVNEYRARAGG